MPRFQDDHGVSITYYEWLVDNPRAIVQISHGLGEYAGRYQQLAEVLNAGGYSVYADDHRGHGQTGVEQHNGDLSQMGKLGVGGLRAAEDAIRRLSALIRIAQPGIPLIYLGHSWGSLMGQRILNRHPHDYDAVILTGSAYRMPGYMEAGDLNKKYATAGSLGVEWLSRDESVQKAFIKDPLTFDAKVLKLFGLADGLRLFGRPGKKLDVDMPLLLMVGEEDSVGGERSVEKLANEYHDRSGMHDVTVIIYEGARHEIFNETNRDEVFVDLLEWLGEKFGDESATATASEDIGAGVGSDVGVAKDAESQEPSVTEKEDKPAK